MVSEQSSDVKFEIGHVLFFDIVGYSKLLINEQSEQIRKLKEIVRGTEQFRLAEAEGKLLRLSTGDGGALVFRTSSEAPVRCAVEISKEFKRHPELRVRMGIHSGPVNEITDLNEQANIAGAGINIAQRVMDCGDAGHILLSKRVADDLEQYPRWRPHLHGLGECEVKHGARFHAVNLYTDEVGNPQAPEKFKTAWAAEKARPKSAIPKWALIGASVFILVAIAFGSFLFWQRGKPKTSAVTSPIPEKSIAVLPFVDLSQNKDQEYFSDGIAEELLNRLAQLPDLKVAARTSAFQFRGKNLGMADIGRQIKVGHVLEGSVRKSGGNVRISAQLIQCNSGYHIWSQTFDRAAADVLKVQDEIASAIATALEAKLGGRAGPAKLNASADPAAYDDYLQARAFLARRTGDNLKQALAAFDRVIARDPNYSPAHSGRAFTLAVSVSWGLLLPMRELSASIIASADEAVRLDPENAEAYLVR